MPFDRPARRIERDSAREATILPTLQTQAHSLAAVQFALQAYVFLDLTATLETNELDDKAQELVKLVEQLEMGRFFAERLKGLLEFSHTPTIWSIGDDASFNRNQEIHRQDGEKYRKQLEATRSEIEALVVELLDHQEWT